MTTPGLALTGTSSAAKRPGYDAALERRLVLGMTAGETAQYRTGFCEGENMKTCSKCKVEKDESAFSKRSNRKCGLQAYCKACSNSAASLWTKANPVEARAKVDRWREKNMDFIRDADHRRRAANPEKCKASRMVRSAVSKGVLERLPCEVCGEPKTHGHHDDYDKPLDVRWLCPAHHAQLHARLAITKASHV